jgi:hypothetical protein
VRENPEGPLGKTRTESSSSPPISDRLTDCLRRLQIGNRALTKQQ